MECSGQVKFKDYEYLMEEGLQKMRHELIAVLEDDESLQCFQSSHCSCPAPFHQLQVYDHYQLFDHGRYQIFQAPQPARQLQVPKPHSIQGNWPISDHPAQSGMKVEAEFLDQSWEMAKACTDMIPVAMVTRESTKKAFRNKIYSWFHAPKNAEKKVQVKVKENKNTSIELTPAWPPMKQSPWYQMTEKPKTTMKELSYSVAVFIQKFAAPRQTSEKPARTTFLPVTRPIGATRMNIACTSLPVTGFSMSSGIMKMNIKL